MNKELKFEKDIEINEYSLGTDWNNQPILFMSYSRVLADTILKRDKKKIEIDVYRAELDLKIRDNPERHGLSKITESAVTSSIAIEPKYQSLIEELLSLNHEVKILEGAIKAFEHRKKALECKVQLFISGYNATPKEHTEEESRLATKELRKRISDEKKVSRTNKR